MLKLDPLFETGKIDISFPFSLEEYEEALKVNALFDFFQYIHPSPLKIGVVERKNSITRPVEIQIARFSRFGHWLEWFARFFFFPIQANLNLYKLAERAAVILVPEQPTHWLNDWLSQTLGQ